MVLTHIVKISSKIQASKTLKQSAALLLQFCVFVMSQAAAQNYDPWRETNKRLFRLNDSFDKPIVRPIVASYILFMPRAAREGIGNAFSNIDDINVLVNDLLQLMLGAALNDSGRL